MPRIVMSPWLAAGAGLSQGFGQGVGMGMELAMQKKALQQQKQHDAMNLLMQGIKAMPDDPQQGEAYMDFFRGMYEQTTGTKLPPMPWAQAKPWSERIKADMDEMGKLDPSMSETDKLRYAMARRGVTPPKGAAEQKVHAIQDPSYPGGWRPMPPGMVPHFAPAANQPIPIYDPNDPTKKVTTLDPHARFAPKPTEHVGNYLVTNTKTGETYQKTLKPGEKLTPDETIADKKNVEEKIEKDALKRIDKTLEYQMGTQEEQEKMLERAKEAVRKELQPWTKEGGTKGKSGFQGPGMYSIKGKPTPIKTAEEYQRAMSQ